MDGRLGTDGGQLLLSAQALQRLSDGKSENRKRAADEILSKVKDCLDRRDVQRVYNFIDYIHVRQLHNVQPSARKGALLALSVVGLAAGQGTVKNFVRELVHPILSLLKGEREAAVRYSAAETLYNIARVARGHILVCFSELFDALCHMHADNDKPVQSAAAQLDLLVKDICTESRDFDVDTSIVALCGQIENKNPYIRSYLLSWLRVLESVPDLNLVNHLHVLLGGVLSYLSDHNRSVVNLTWKTLDGFMRRLQQTVRDGRTVEWSPIIQIIIKNCSERDTDVRNAALGWAVEILSLANRRVLPHAADLLSAILGCVADREEKIRIKASAANEQLASLVRAAQEDEAESGRVELRALLPLLFDALTRALANVENATRCAALVWLQMLLEHNPDMVEKCFDRLFPELMAILSASDRVVEMDLQVLAIITRPSRGGEAFTRFLSELVSLLQRDGYKLMPRAGMLMRSLAKWVNSIDLFQTLAGILVEVPDLTFVSSLVTTLNVILLTSPELLELRTVLKRGLEDEHARNTFKALYRCWCHNAVAVVSLCLLSRAYEHACALIKSFGDREISVSMMVQIDRLVQLIESPVFAYIRVALLEPAENPYLVKALFGILMLLPQSSTYQSLHKRLKSVNTLCLLNNRLDAQRPAGKSPADGMDWPDLLRYYKDCEDRKETFFRSQQQA
eukprot:Hpha_TRINITY_DN25873_c0_g1::TRINITY_DN25873_c0_g1_i1::g.20006::m.20006/K15305/VAC14, TAX1BP2; vacuole morphology and inheritance protein 14